MKERTLPTVQMWIRPVTEELWAYTFGSADPAGRSNRNDVFVTLRELLARGRAQQLTSGVTSRSRSAIRLAFVEWLVTEVRRWFDPCILE